MNMPMCSRCKKNIAVVFITKIEGPDKTTQEGLCLKCARELGVKPLDNIMEQMGITEDDLEALSGEIGSLSDLNDLVPAGSDGADDDAPHETDPAAPVPSSPAPPLPPQTPLRDSARTRTQAPPREDKKRKYLNNYCENLTRKAAEGRIDHIVGRDRETDRVIQILNRRQKNNPCLIGEPGVGKTAVAEGLAVRINEGKVPFKMRNKEVHLLDLTALVAGTQFRGQFESRMKGLIDEVKKLGNIILVIDEVHNIVGAGDSEGSMNAANILKPALARGDIQVIGATTLKEYRKYIEKDAALERRFQPVQIDEPTPEDAVEILKGLRDRYEAHHRIKIPDEAIDAAVKLSVRYVTGRYLPDKAIDVIDEACSRVRLSTLTAPPDLKALEDEIAAVAAKKEEAVKSQDFENAAKLRDEEKQKREALEARKKEWSEQQTKTHGAVTADDIAAVISGWTGVPVAQLTEDEGQRLLHLEDTLHQRVIGQDEAVTAVAKAIRRSRVGLRDPKRPIGSFLFLGPTGVGKTELAKALAQALFDDERNMVRIDMTEYMEKFSVSRLIGAPPGYVGYEEGGQLTEAVRRKPYSVVLFDEVEKAHPDVFNILLQVLDDGRITDSQGRTVDFKNTVIILTSNLGSDIILNDLEQRRAEGSNELSEDARKQIDLLLKSKFRPEFLNRLDEIVYYKSLTKDETRKIVDLQLEDLRKRMDEGKHLKLDVTTAAKDFIIDSSYDSVYGARPIKRFIQSRVETLIAKAIIQGSYTEGATLTVDYDGTGLVLR